MHGNSKYTPELAKEICDRLETGETLRSVCRSEGMPSKQAVLRWRDQVPDFGDQYARARELGYKSMAEEILDIADDGQNDWMERETRAGNITVVNEECVKRSQLRVDTRKWLLSKCLPKIYGDKLSVDAKHEAGDDFKAMLQAISSGQVKGDE